MELFIILKYREVVPEKEGSVRIKRIVQSLKEYAGQDKEKAITVLSYF